MFNIEPENFSQCAYKAYNFRKCHKSDEGIALYTDYANFCLADVVILLVGDSRPVGFKK